MGRILRKLWLSFCGICFESAPISIVGTLILFLLALIALIRQQWVMASGAFAAGICLAIGIMSGVGHEIKEGEKRACNKPKP